MKTKLFITTTLMVLFSAMAFSQANNLSSADLEVITTEEKGDLTTFEPTLTNSMDEMVTVQYEIDLYRKGKSGTSKNSQSGEVTIEPGKKAVLSTSTINIQSKDVYTYQVKVFKDGEVIIAKEITNKDK